MPGLAIIHVTSEPGATPGGAPIAGAGIAVVEPGTGTVQLATTDATGVAAITVVPHSRVWVDVRQPRAHLYLIEDVSPLDVIAVGGRPVTGTPSVAGTLEVEFTPLPGPYVFRGTNVISCGDPGVETSPGHITYTWSAGCAAPAREVEITAYDTTGAAAGFLRIPGVSPAITGSLDATGIAWDLSGRPYRANYAGLDGVDFVATRVFSNASWQYLRVDAALTGGAGSVIKVDATLPDPAVAMTELDHGNRTKQFGDDPVVPVQVPDLAIDPASLLPFISSPTYSPSTHTVAWEQTTTGIAPQLVTTTFVDHDQLWTVYAPVTGNSIVIPDVPDELTTTIDVPATSAIAVNVALVYSDGSSYRDLLKDIDYHRTELDAAPFRWGARTRWSVGY